MTAKKKTQGHRASWELICLTTHEALAMHAQLTLHSSIALDPLQCLGLVQPGSVATLTAEEF